MILCREGLSCPVQGTQKLWSLGTERQERPLVTMAAESPSPGFLTFKTLKGLCSSLILLFTDGETGPEKDSWQGGD